MIGGLKKVNSWMCALQLDIYYERCIERLEVKSSKFSILAKTLFTPLSMVIPY